MSRYSNYDNRGGPPREYGWDHRDSWNDRSSGGGGGSGSGSGGDWHHRQDWDEPRRGSGGGRYDSNSSGGGYDRDYHHTTGARDHHRMPVDRDDWRSHPPPPPARQDWHHREDRMDWEPPRSHLRKRENYEEGRDYGRDYRGRGPPPPSGGSAEDSDWKRRKVDPDQWDDHAPSSERGPVSGPRNRMEPSEPSQHVIFLGLEPDFVEADLHAYLASVGVTVDSVTIIRDRVTGQSRGFGFAQFPSVQEASAFLLPNFPFIYIPPTRPNHHSYHHHHHPNGRRVKIDFSSSPPESGGGHHQNSGAGGSAGAAGGAPAYNSRRKGDPNAPSTVKNDGTRDIGSTQTPVLLFRSLDKLNTRLEDIEEATKGIPSASTGMRRILLVKDKHTAVGWGFAFIEFVSTEAASAAFASIMSPVAFPTGFRILDQVVAASFALPYAFQLLPPGSEKEDGCIQPTKAIGGTDEGGNWTRYWDEAAVVEEKMFDVVVPPSGDASSSSAKEKDETKDGKRDKEKKEKKKVKDEEDARVKEENPTSAPVATALSKTAGPISLKLGKASNTQTLSGGDAKQGNSSSSAAPNALGFNADGDGDQPEEKGDGKGSGGDGDDDSKGKNSGGTSDKTKKSVAPMVGSAKTAKNINKWNANKETASTSATAGNSTEGSAGETIHDLKPGDKGFEYSDPVALTCLLCLRQLKTLHQLQRHNTESEMHKANLKNHKQCKAAKEKVAAARKALETKPEGSDGGKGDEQQAPKYRDRAEERRKIHNQPDVPPPAASSSSGTNRAGSKATITIAPRSAPLEPAKDENNVGNKLLKKMGWNEGGGLGVEGEGRVEPIKPTVYTAGVGLGAAKPKEVTSSTFSAGSGTGGSNSYAEAAKESARERLKS